ncbi:uncharacterized protein CEXT_549661 [Caerostris extrusa]|uniref:Uncharacterized protein n=1 Tax=Caerostris extrusa TaxID=172846 RepID=A0AAV4SE23_CAEEX|nr:uncharacterized protein CEXT_549661 [Caerostris extrusa]
MNYQIIFLVIASILLAREALVSSGPVTEIDCDTMIGKYNLKFKELYRILMANGGIPGFHAMVRKAQRIPSLRLRFGKRDQPTWAEPNPSYDVEKDHYTD